MQTDMPPAKRACRRPRTPLPFETDPCLDAMFECIDGLMDLVDAQNRAANVIKSAWAKRKPPMPVIYENRSMFRELAVEH